MGEHGYVGSVTTMLVLYSHFDRIEAIIFLIKLPNQHIKAPVSHDTDGRSYARVSTFIAKSVRPGVAANVILRAFLEN